MRKVRKCHKEKRASHKGCSISLPHHLFIPLRYTPDLQGAHLKPWERETQHNIFPLQVLHDFIFRYARLPLWLRGSSTVPTLLIQRIAVCNAPWGLLGAHKTVIHLSLQAWLFMSPASQWEVSHEVGVFPKLVSCLPMVAGQGPRESSPSQAGNTAASKIKCNLFHPSLLLALLPLAFSLSLEMLSQSKDSLCLNPRLSLSKLGILYFH